MYFCKYSRIKIYDKPQLGYTKQYMHAFTLKCKQIPMHYIIAIYFHKYIFHIENAVLLCRVTFVCSRKIMSGFNYKTLNVWSPLYLNSKGFTILQQKSKYIYFSSLYWHCFFLISLSSSK